MADEHHKNRLYTYTANSSLVLEAARDRRRIAEPKGEAESLRGRLDGMRMGDRYRETRAAAAAAAEATDKEAMVPAAKKKRLETQGSSRGSDLLKGEGVLAVAEELGRYTPRSRETAAAYEELLACLRPVVGDVPEEVLRAAAHDVLEVLCEATSNGSGTSLSTERTVANLLGLPSNSSMNNFHTWVNLAKQITDFKMATTGVGKGFGNEENGDGEEAMAVVFDDEDDDPLGGLDAESDAEDSDAEAAERGTTGALHGSSLVDTPITPATSNDTLPAHSIDGHWLQRQLAPYYPEATEAAKLASEVLSILQMPDDHSAESALVSLLDFDKFALVRRLLTHRWRIAYCIRLRQAANDAEKQAVEAEMSADATHGGAAILSELRGESIHDTAIVGKDSSAMEITTQSGANVEVTSEEAMAATVAVSKPLTLSDYEFSGGGHLMTNSRVELPPKSWRAQKKGYEEVHVPALAAVQAGENELRSIESLPAWMRPAFQGVRSLNRVQSRMADAALGSTENLLLCAPTGSGKTNVALLAMLGLMARYRDPRPEGETGEEAEADLLANPGSGLRLSEFKIVYVAPMKALVQECVQSFGARLKPYGITVQELSGDASLSAAAIAATQIIVTTPEKWDVVTRKASERPFTALVKLVIIDEIHLLHDDRGPVLEALVARTLRQAEALTGQATFDDESNKKMSSDSITSQGLEGVRLVGLSATLPNYQDVATFLRVRPSSGLFFFDASYRPVPLQQQFIGVTEKNALRRLALMTEICYEKSLLQAGRNQTLIFTSSRADTAKTARALRDLAMEQDTLGRFVKPGSSSAEILRTEAANANDRDLQELLRDGFAFHHAGLSRADRSLVEDLYADKHIAILVSTATLAWGVNLPAHTVILKGTQMYSPEAGRWVELSPLDIQQMLGRAGRYGLDTEGEGIILTQHSELQYYLSLLNHQLPIESQLVKRLPDLLNAEIVSGTVSSLREAAEWLGYSYLFVRMLRNPVLYGVDADSLSVDPSLWKRRCELVHAASVLLEKSDLVRYDRRTGSIQSTPLGEIAAHYYISHESVAVYRQSLRPSMTEIDIFRLLTASGEFRHIHVRPEEKAELVRLLSRVPIAVKETADEPTAKVNVLLQAYISRLPLDGYALAADMVYVQQSACRLLRALLEMARQKGWALLASRLLELCIATERRQWSAQSPLRQFSAIPAVLLRQLERVTDVPWSAYYDLRPADLGELVRAPKMGRTLFRFVHMLPRLSVEAAAYPLSRGLLAIEVTLAADFEWNAAVHGGSVAFHLTVEDGDGEKILYAQPLSVRPQAPSATSGSSAAGAATQWESFLRITVLLTEPLAPQYFLRVSAERWLHATTVIPVSFSRLVLPERLPPPTELLDLRPLPVSAVDAPAVSALWSGINTLNAIQTQTFFALFESDSSTFLSAPAGAGKTLCAELAILRFLKTTDPSATRRAIFVTPSLTQALSVYSHWYNVFSNVFGHAIGCLTGEDLTADLATLRASHLLVATTEAYDALTRRWQQRKALHTLSLVVFDDLHRAGLFASAPALPMSPTSVHAGAGEAARYEAVVSRTRVLSAALPTPIRIVGLAQTLANGADLAAWIGAAKNSTFCFANDAEASSRRVEISPVMGFDAAQRLAATPRRVFSILCRYAGPGRELVGSGTSKSSGGAPSALLFVPTRQAATLAAIDLVAAATARVARLSSSVTAQFGGVSGNALYGCGSAQAAEDIRSVAAMLSDEALSALLPTGVAYLHEGLSRSEQASIERLFASRAVGVLLVPFASSNRLSVRAPFVGILDTALPLTASTDAGRETDEDLPVHDLLSMAGRATSGTDEPAELLVCCAPHKHAAISRLFDAPLPLESALDGSLHDVLLSEIVAGTVNSAAEAVDLLTWSLLFRRLPRNPNLYGIAASSSRHVSDYLSSLIETSMTDLSAAKLIAIGNNDDTAEGFDGEEAIAPLNLGMVASFYCLSHATIETLAASVTRSTRLRGALEIVSAAAELAALPVRRNEPATLRKLLRTARTGVTTEDGAAHKALALLSAHCSRAAVSYELRADLAATLTTASRVVNALVDVVASQGWLTPALAAMELSQCLVQAMWAGDSPLRQVPHLSTAQTTEGVTIESHLTSAGVESVFDLIDLEDAQRKSVLSTLTPSQRSDVARFCNAYPAIDVTAQISPSDTSEAVDENTTASILSAAGDVEEDEVIAPAVIKAGGNVTLTVSLSRDGVEEGDDSIGRVIAPRWPTQRVEGWWLVVGDSSANVLYAVKRLTLAASATVRLDFVAPTLTGQHRLALYVMSDAYSGADQEFPVQLHIV